jgi:hypothetical protein
MGFVHAKDYRRIFYSSVRPKNLNVPKLLLTFAAVLKARYRERVDTFYPQLCATNATKILTIPVLLFVRGWKILPKVFFWTTFTLPTVDVGVVVIFNA